MKTKAGFFVALPNNQKRTENGIGAAFRHLLICGLFFLSPHLFAQSFYDNLGYVIDGNSAIITEYAGIGGAVSVPSSIDFFPVTGIANNAFNGPFGVTSVTLPNSVTNIGTGAFSGETSLGSVTFGDNVLSIGDLAFSSCTSLGSITLPATVTNLGVGVFAGCTSLTSLTVPAANTAYSSTSNILFNKNQTAIIQYPAGIVGSTYTIATNITTIASYAFSGCGFTNATIPAGITNIGDAPFYGCTQLKAISVNAQNTNYSSLSGVVFNFGQTTLVEFPGGSISSTYTIPSTVTSLADDAFLDCSSLTGLTIPNSVTSIGQEDFENCTGLTSVSIGSGVASMGSNSFEGCTKLTSITVSAQNLYYSSLNGVLFDKPQVTLLQYPLGAGGTYTVPNGVTSIAANAFYLSGSLSGLVMPNTVTNIGQMAFAACSALKSATIPGSVNTIPYGAFLSDRDLTSVIISNGVANIGSNAFESCSALTSITIPGSVTNISSAAFYLCTSLSSLTISNGVGSIGTSAFTLDPITRLVVPASVTNIADDAFFDCTKLTGVFFSGNAPTADSTVFEAESPTVYYLPGTTGWGSTFAGLSTVQWNPAIQTNNANFGIQTNQFGFNITGPANIAITVQASTNFSTWTNVQSLSITNGSVYFADPAWSNYPNRFYRIVSTYP